MIFQSSIKENEKLERLIQEAIKRHFEFDVPVLIVNLLILKSIINSCPFSEEKSYFTLLKTKPEQQFINELKALKIVNAEIVVTNKCVYFYSDKGYGNSKRNNNFIERRLKVRATTRNYKTIMKLIDMANNN